MIMSRSNFLSRFFKPFFLSYVIIPPYVQTLQSAPDVFGKIIFSASIDICRICSRLGFENKFITDAAAATQHADEEPNPTPGGI